MNISIRHEIESDCREVEELTREAFWNLYVPGCDEHYLVHKMRTHPDFIPELDFIAAVEGRIVGNIMFTRSHLVDEAGSKVEITTFGPISVLPGFQRQGIGSALITRSKEVVIELGYKAIVIQGHPGNYCRHGFKSSKDYNISDAEGKFPYSLLVLELEKGFLEGHKWRYHDSKVYSSLDSKDVEEFDRLFEPKKKEHRYSQEEFHIASRAFIL